MGHGVDFDLNPLSHTNKDEEQGKQRILIEDKTIPSQFDGRKTSINIMRPSDDELESLEVFEMTSPLPFEPKKGKNDVTSCRDIKKNINNTLGGLRYNSGKIG